MVMHTSNPSTQEVEVWAMKPCLGKGGISQQQLIPKGVISHHQILQVQCLLYSRCG
jgi:hypothetical protein